VAQGSHQTWEPDAPRVCSMCGERVKVGERFTRYDHLNGTIDTFHNPDCLPYRIQVIVTRREHVRDTG
jgi:hypothetical protein